MNIHFPPEPKMEPIRNRAATPDDCIKGLTAFAADVPSPDLANLPLDVFLPQIANISDENGKPQAIVIIQAEVARTPENLVVIGYQDGEGNFGACTSGEVEPWHSFFVFHDKPEIDLDAAMNQSPETFSRQGNTLATKPTDDEDPILFVRHYSGDFVSKFATQISEESEHAEAIQKCSRCFVVSFQDLEEVLDEINTLIDAQHILGELTDGYIFLEWNGSLEKSDF